MSLVLWTKLSQLKVFDALGIVLKNDPELKVHVVNDMTVIPKLEGMQVLFAMGEEPIDFLGKCLVVPKNKKVGSLRGASYPLGQSSSRVMVSYSPGVSEMDYGRYVELQCDVASAMRLCKTGSLDPVYGDYKYVDDLKAFREKIEKKFEETGKPVDASLDLETVGLDPYLLAAGAHPGAYIVGIQVSCEKGTAEMVHFLSKQQEEAWMNSLNLGDLSWFLTTSKVKLRGANLKYDLLWLWVRGKLECTNFVFDTTVVGGILDENRSNGLDVHVKIYAPNLGGYSDKFDKTVDKSRFDLLKHDSMLLNYAAGDADGTLQVAEVMRKKLVEDGKLTSFYVNILHPAVRAFEMVERGGIHVDIDKYKELESDLNVEIERLVVKARSILGGRIWAKHSDPDKMGGINLTKASMLTDFMFSPMGLNLKPKMWTAGTEKMIKSKTPMGPDDWVASTAVEHLMMFKHEPKAKEFVLLLEDYGSATKTQSTYVKGFCKHIRSDGRLHPTYWFFAGMDDEGGTNTGRLSCRDPAFQTVPKHTKWAPRIRMCFTAPPGMKVVERDYNQGELRVVACVANEQNMIQAYRDGKDLHVVTGADVVGLPYEVVVAMKKTDPKRYEEIRQPAKPSNFGLLYGQFPAGFMMYAESNYGVVMTLEEAQMRWDKFFALYPGLTEYHKTYKAFASKWKFVRSPLGRIRHLPLINSKDMKIRMKSERQSINSPVQSTLSDLLIWSIAEENRTGMMKIAPSFGACHDAAYNYVPEDKVSEIVPKFLQIMENLPFEKVDWKPQLKFLADAKIGSSMGDLKAF